MTKKVVNWNAETGVGEVSKKAFIKGLPEGLTPDVIDKVDEYRDGFLANITNEAIDYAKNAFIAGDSPEIITVPSFTMGGKVQGSVVIDPNFSVVASSTIINSEAMNVVMAKAQFLHKEMNKPNTEDTLVA